MALLALMAAPMGGAQESQPADAELPPRLSLEEITGVYAIKQDSPFADEIWQLPITGVAMRQYWKNIQPAAGVYDWSLFDETVEKARQHNKKVKLFVLFGSGVPEWVGCRFVIGSDDSIHDAAGARTPVPWDEKLLEAQTNFIRAFAERYRTEPHVSFLHIAGPSARWAELVLPHNLQQQPDYSNQKIWGAWKTILDTWVEVRGNKRNSLSVSASPPYYTTLGDEIITYAAGKPTDPADRGVLGEDFAPQWCYLDMKFEKSIRETSAQYFPKCIIGQQMWGATGWPEGRRCDDFEGTIDLAREVGSTFIEIYEDDLMKPELAAYAIKTDRMMKENLDTGATTRPLSGAALSAEAAKEKFAHLLTWAQIQEKQGAAQAE